MKIAPYLTAEEFCRDPQNVEVLQEFLASPQGQNFLSVIFGARPSRLLSDSRIARDGNNLRAATAAEATPERAEHLLGRCEGYESVLELMTQTLTVKARELPRSSSKASGPRTEIRPVSPPKP